MTEPAVVFDRMPAPGPSGTMGTFTRPGFDRDVSFVVDSIALSGPGRVNNDLGSRRGFAMLCAVEGCSKTLESRGLCSMHRARVRRHGDVFTVLPGSRAVGAKGSPEERFWAKVNKDGPVPAHRPELGPCAEWVGYRNPKGYGQFRPSPDLGAVLVHRWAFEQAHGPIPAGLGVLHHCDNPPCVRDEHHFLGTTSDNNRDMWDKGRGRLTGPRGETHHSSKLSDDDVREIRHRFAAGESKMALARSFGVAHNAIRAALIGKRGLP